MLIDVWSVESEEFSVYEILQSKSIRKIYIETLEKAIEKLKEKNNYKLETEKNFEHTHDLPTIIFSELSTSPDQKRASLKMTCYQDRKVFRESADWDG